MTYSLYIMKNRREEYRMVDGTITYSINKYATSWSQAFDKFKKLFPEAELLGCDPDFLIKYKGRTTTLSREFVLDAIKGLQIKENK